ncbi:hypothetical protein ABZ719_17800 [Streptomyces sp. NPDC006743]|uniref:hypothetical protein n=1 Tax=Streptomyces sp. NPDC006743 TaxID=3154480 RepID=UPI0034525B1D
MTAGAVPPLLVLACWAVPAVRAGLAGRAGTAGGSGAAGRADTRSPAAQWAARFGPPLAALALTGAWWALTSPRGAGDPFRLGGRAWQLLPAGLLVGAGELACAALLCGTLGELAAVRRDTDAQRPVSQWAALQRSAWMRHASALPGAGTWPPLVPLALGLLAAWAEQAAVFGVAVATALDRAGPVAGWGCALLLAALGCRGPHARRSPRVAPAATLLTTAVDTALFQAVALVLPLAGARWTFLLLARSRREPSSTGRTAGVTTIGG